MRRTLTLYGVAMAAVAIVAFLIPLGLLARSTTEERALGLARQEAQSVGVVAAVAGPDRAGLLLAAAADQSARRTTIFLPDGHTLGATAARSPAVDLAATGRAFTARDGGGLQVLVPIGGSDGVIVVRTYVPDSLLHKGWRTTLVTLALVGAAFMAGAVFAAARIAGRLSRSVYDLATVAGRLADGDLAARAGSGGPPEIGYVAGVLNGLGGRIADMLRAERELSADLSHRLRTPLTALRLDLDGLRDPLERDRMAEHVAAMQQQVDEVVRLSRAPRVPESPRCDAASVVRERMAFWAVPAADQGRPVELDITAASCPVSADADTVGAALDVLVDNVFCHTPPGTGFSVVVAREADRVLVVVHDHGPGLGGPAVVARGRSGAGSTGLGLDIARRAAQDSGGRLLIDDSVAGGRIVLEFPVALIGGLTQR